MDAIKAYSELIDGASRCVGLYREAQLPIPQKLRSFLGLDEEGRPQAALPFHLAATKPEEVHRPTSNGRGHHVSLNDPALDRAQRIPAKPNHGERPVQADEGWVSLLAREASPQALTLAVMRGGRAIKMADLNREVAILRGMDGSSSAAYNVVQRLHKDGEALETEAGWVLVNFFRAGIVQGGILWSPKELLTDSDFAAIRREAIMLLLKENGPLITGAITRGLGRCEWLQAPAGRHQAKADLRQLQKEGYVKRLPSGEWFTTGKDWGSSKTEGV